MKEEYTICTDCLHKVAAIWQSMLHAVDDSLGLVKQTLVCCVVLALDILI